MLLDMTKYLGSVAAIGRAAMTVRCGGCTMFNTLLERLDDPPRWMAN